MEYEVEIGENALPTLVKQGMLKRSKDTKIGAL